MAKSDQFEAQFNEIINDNRSGSVKVLDKVIQWIENYAGFNSGTVNWQKDLILSLNEILKKHPDLIVLREFRDSFSKNLQRTTSADQLLEWIAAYKKKWENCYLVIKDNLKKCIDLNNKTLLVHSHSQTVTEVLRLLKVENYDFKVVQTESRPMLEGRDQARELARIGVDCTMITDLAIGLIIPQIDIVLLGADQFNDHAFINKTGSYSIAVVSRHHKKKVYVLADSRKQVVEFSISQERPASEVWSNPPYDLKLINQYFELTPLHLVERLISEKS